MMKTWQDAHPLVNGWRLTTEHAASSYGVPVLVDPEGVAYGPADMLPLSAMAAMRGIAISTLKSRAEAGTLPVVRLRGHWYVRADTAVTIPDPERTGRPPLSTKEA